MRAGYKAKTSGPNRGRVGGGDVISLSNNNEYRLDKQSSPNPNPVEIRTILATKQR